MYKGRKVNKFIKRWNWDTHKTQLLPPVRDIYIRKCKQGYQTIKNLLKYLITKEIGQVAFQKASETRPVLARLNW